MPPSPLTPAVPGDDRGWPTVSVVLPALNEEANLPLVLEGLPPVDEVVVVDGGSTDDTVAVAREVRPDAMVVRQTRTGKGNALTCGFAVCTGDIVVTLNADGSTDPGELPRYVDALLAGAEVAHGSRYRDGGGNLAEGRWDALANRSFNRLVNLFFGTRFTDLGFGYNAFWRALLPVLDLPDPHARTPRRGTRLWGEGPEIEPLINIRMATQGLRVVEVASVGYPRIYGEPDRHPVRDGGLAMRTAAGEYLRRWRISREAARHPGAHALAEERRSIGRRAARRLDSTPAAAAGHRADRAPGSRADRSRVADRSVEQRSWMETYADPGAAAAGGTGRAARRAAAHSAGGTRRRAEPMLPAVGPTGPGPTGLVPTGLAPAAGTAAGPEQPARRRSSRRAGKRRPDLTVITGSGAPPSWSEPADRPPLRAVSGEPYERA